MKMETNWPELTEYSRCCSLKTGIYITAVFQLLCFVCRSYFDVTEIESWSYVLKRREGHCDCNLTQSLIELQEKDRLILQIVNQHVIGILFRLVLIASIFILIYGIHWGKPMSLSIFLKINMPLCVINTFQLALNVYIYDLGWRIVMVFSALMDAYQLVAVRSMYKHVTGKSMIYKEADMCANRHYSTDVFNSCQHVDNARDHNTGQLNDSAATNNANAANNATISDSTRVNTNIIRCETCNSVLNSEERAQANNSESAGTNTPVDRPNPPRYDDVPDVERSKELNFKEGATIFDPSQLTPRRHPLIEEPNGGSSVSTGRPSCLDIGISQNKLSLDCDPVIYDQDQLNIGHSPIIEDRAIL